MVMDGPNPRSTASIAGHPLHPMVIPFPIAFLVTTLVADLAYWKTGNAMWATGATWLVGAGVVMGLVAALAGFTDFFGSGQIRALNAVWRHMIGNLLAVAVSAGNWWVHYSQGAAGIVPTGLVLSLIVVLILLYTGWQGWEMVYRRHVGVAD
jgi:uncharacterized membrane protein